MYLRKMEDICRQPTSDICRLPNSMWLKICYASELRRDMESGDQCIAW